MKAISFDLWGTLIKSNPEFKPQRDEYLFSNFAYGPDYDFFRKKVREVEKTVDVIAEGTGEAVPTKVVISLILKELGNDLTQFKMKDYQKIEQDLLDLALQYPPSFYDENTLPILQWLKEEGFDMISASNTGLLNGVTMRWVQNEIGLDKFMRDQVYSDITGYSKPNVNFFEKVEKVLGTKDYIHVGDNVNADGGAKNPYIINTNGLTILDLKKHIETTQTSNFFSESFH